jgi:phage shock protein PspC (stress-responsive transcriptional regulator)
MMSNMTEQRPPTSPTVPDLVRPRDDRVVAGVASGIARRLGIGPGWVRIGFVLMLFLGGLGLLAYGIGWLTIRDEGASDTLLDDWIDGLEGSTAWIGAGLVVLAGMILLSATDVISGDLVLAAGLFLAGLLLYRGRFPTRDRSGEPSPPTTSLADPPPPSPGDEPPPAAADPEPGSSLALPELDIVSPGADFGPRDGGDLNPPPPPAPPDPIHERRPPPTPPRPPSHLGRLTVAALLVTLGTMAVFDNLDLASPDLRHYVAAAVLVTGAGLLVGAFVGRARGLVVLGFLLLPLLFFSSAVRIDIFGEYSERIVRPADIAEIEESYELSGSLG